MIHPSRLLRQYGIEPKKSLGQSFLADRNVLGRIVAAAEIDGGDEVLEIGPGLGALTLPLAKKAERVVAVEIDGRFLPLLQAELATFDNVTLVHGDILALDPATWFDGPYKVAANVPYYITGALLRHLLSAGRRPTLMALTVQKEVAERITASPPHMSLLAVSVQYYARASVVEKIKAGAFWPRPDVDSAVVRFDVRPDDEMPTHAVQEQFFRVARAGFAQKRKQLHNNLRGLGYTKEQIASLLETTGIDGRRRAETLDLEEWRRLALHLADLPPARK